MKMEEGKKKIKSRMLHVLLNTFFYLQSFVEVEYAALRSEGGEIS